MTPSSDEQIGYAAWNPLHQGRLLMWLFLKPQHYIDYKQQAGKTAVRKTGAWLSSTLIWLPLFIVTLGSVLNTIPNGLHQGSGLVLAGVTGLWFLTGWLGQREDEHENIPVMIVTFLISLLIAYLILDKIFVGFIVIMATIMARSIAVIAALGWSSSVASGVNISVAVSIAIAIAGGLKGGSQLVLPGIIAVISASVLAYGIRGTVSRNLDKQQANLTSGLLFVSLAFSYVALIWVYLLGGWQLLYR